MSKFLGWSVPNIWRRVWGIFVQAQGGEVPRAREQRDHEELLPDPRWVHEVSWQHWRLEGSIEEVFKYHFVDLSVWPDVAKIRHFGMMLTNFGHFERLPLLFGKTSNLPR